jgi:hypothetical protein
VVAGDTALVEKPVAEVMAHQSAELEDKRLGLLTLRNRCFWVVAAAAVKNGIPTLRVVEVLVEE